MINTIIFDLEGVVIDSEIIWDKGQEVFLRRRGFIYAKDRIKHLMTGKSLIEGIEIMKKFYGFEGDSRKLADERREIVKRMFRDELTFIASFEEFYNNIRTKYKTCIATSLDKELLEITNHRMTLSKLFDGNIFSISDVNHISKPNPDLFLYSAKKLKSQPQFCFVIEDSPYGIEASKRAGMRCIALSTTYSKDKLTKADLFVDSYSEIDLSKF